jgi:hypothetical protein
MKSQKNITAWFKGPAATIRVTTNDSRLLNLCDYLSKSVNGPETSVVNIHKKNGIRPDFDVYIGRTVAGTEFTEDSKWSNPHLPLPTYKAYIRELIRANPQKYNLSELVG